MDLQQSKLSTKAPLPPKKRKAPVDDSAVGLDISAVGLDNRAAVNGAPVDLEKLLSDVQSMARNFKSNYKLGLRASQIGIMHDLCITDGGVLMKTKLGRIDEEKDFSLDKPSDVGEKYKCRKDKKNKSLLFERNGFAMFVYDNEVLLFRKAEQVKIEVSGGVRMRVLDRAMSNEKRFFSQEFMDFAKAEFERVRRSVCPKITGNDDLKGDALDGEMTRHHDYPGFARVCVRDLKKVKCLN